MLPPSNIAIIGAGLSGATLALCLKKQHGIHCTIYEVRPSADGRGTHIALTPNSLRVMQHVGVYDKLRANGHNYEELSVNNAIGQQLAKFLNGSESLYNFRSLRVHRSMVQKILLEEAEEQGIAVHYGMKLKDLNEGVESGVKLEFDDGTVTTADFVIGADGIHSRVRPAVSDIKPVYSGLLGITGTIDGEQVDNPLGHYLPAMYFGQSGFMAVLPCSYDGTEISFFSTMDFPERSREGWDALANSPDEMHEIMNARLSGDWAAPVRSICDKADRQKLSLWPFYIVPTMKTWASPSGRIVVIGDAAHAVTPQGGQGGGLALEDAETLAYTMARPEFMQNRSKLLRIWQNHRQERLDQVQAYTNRNASLRGPGRTYLRQTLKEYTVWAAFKYLGPSGGIEWLNDYDAEIVVSKLSGA